MSDVIYSELPLQAFPGLLSVERDKARIIYQDVYVVVASSDNIRECSYGIVIAEITEDKFKIAVFLGRELFERFGTALLTSAEHDDLGPHVA